MDNQAYDHDLSVMNNNSAKKKELEVGIFDKKLLERFFSSCIV